MSAPPPEEHREGGGEKPDNYHHHDGDSKNIDDYNHHRKDSNNNISNNENEDKDCCHDTPRPDVANNTKHNDDDDEDEDEDEDAVDDTEDLPDAFVRIQKTLSCERRRRQSRLTHGIQDLLPFAFSPLIRPLTISDLESCVALENAAFSNPEHRCSREKFIYRLTECPELCMGVYCTVVPSNTKGWEIDTLHTAHAVETGRDDGAVSVLLAHIVATLSHDDVVTDASMDYPDKYKAEKSSGTSNNNSNSNSNSGSGTNKSKIGHQATGRTICIHSLAVHPKLQGVGMGQLILKSYMQQVKNSAIADRIALICEEYLVNYYKRFGFSHIGPSEAAFGGGGWHDMAFDLRSSAA
ncbi:hypothetical protein O1611_g2054 [Lasiodiplodia mahajangana]|uniref:Uncharacterized protein n=1 Tax=Lasiodiplodia mahajangana TaxID=1108764 RepID=A0ACC2JWJ3_9PEZI|nr:hypothetical protein O1611_g2054 [Lasiodiplodia mahajangana]